MVMFAATAVITVRVFGSLFCGHHFTGKELLAVSLAQLLKRFVLCVEFALEIYDLVDFVVDLGQGNVVRFTFNRLNAQWEFAGCKMSNSD